MTKKIKNILLVVGLLLLGCGNFTLIAPEALLSLGGLSIEAQDNTNSYITIVLGLVAIALKFLGGKK